MTTHVDLAFPARGGVIPLDHGYALYAALSHKLPAVHEADWLGVHPIGGKVLGRDTLALGPGSTVTLRVPVERIGTVLPLAGAILELHRSRLVLGVPSVRALAPVPSLDARLVLIKLTNPPTKADGSLDVVVLRERFETEARRQLDALGIACSFEITGRRSLTVRGRRVIGFSARAHGLGAGESIRLQIKGLGGKRSMGAGMFRPTRGPVAS